MTSDETATSGKRTACAYPGCTRPPRPRAGTGGGKPPIYCDLINDNTGKWAHTPVTARREEERRARPPTATGGTARHVSAVADGGVDGGPATERLATVARERAGSLLEQFRTEASRLGDTIAAALDEFAKAADPDKVRAELDEAQRRVERVEFDSAEQVKDANRDRDRSAAAALQLMKDCDEAITVRNQAIDDLEHAERDRDAALVAAEGARADAVAAVAEVKRDAAAEIERVRQQTASDVAQIRVESADQVSDARKECDEAKVVASRADAIAKREASDAERLRAEFADLRRDHKKELADLRADHKTAVADQAAQLREVYEAQIARLGDQIVATNQMAAGRAQNEPGGEERPMPRRRRQTSERSTGTDYR